MTSSASAVDQKPLMIVLSSGVHLYREYLLGYVVTRGDTHDQCRRAADEARRLITLVAGDASAASSPSGT